MTELTMIAQYAVTAIIAVTIIPPICMAAMVYATMRAMSRNPSAATQMQSSMLLGLAFCEALGIYALMIGLSLLFVYPGMVGMVQ